MIIIIYWQFQLRVNMKLFHLKIIKFNNNKNLQDMDHLRMDAIGSMIEYQPYPSMIN